MHFRDIQFIIAFFRHRCWRCEAITGCPENTTGKSGCTRSGPTWSWTCRRESICRTARSTRTAAWPSCICGIPNKNERSTRSASGDRPTGRYGRQPQTVGNFRSLTGPVQRPVWRLSLRPRPKWTRSRDVIASPRGICREPSFRK